MSILISYYKEEGGGGRRCTVSLGEEKRPTVGEKLERNTSDGRLLGRGKKGNRTHLTTH